MNEQSSKGALVDRLVADLRPVRRLPAPVVRAAGWLALVLSAAVALGLNADLGIVRERLMSVPDMWLAVLGSAATAILAAIAAFELNMPDRSRLWALLPLPSFVLWMASSGLGCARVWLDRGPRGGSWEDQGSCVFFIVGLSIPLSVMMVVMLRRGYSLTPTLTAAVAGLAVSAAAATLLNFFHPYDAALEDLLVHASAVLFVIIGNRIAGGRLIARRLVAPA